MVRYFNKIISMLEKAESGIKKAIDHLELEFSKLQAGRANPAMVEDIMIESYGSMQPIKNTATVGLLDAQTLTIKPWDRSIIHAIAKAITDAGMGLNPQTMADSVMIKIPALTEERRRDIVKIAKKLTEEAKVSMRNARQDSLKAIKKAEDDKEISEDQARDYEDALQKLVDQGNKKTEELLKIKETDIMKV
ncbi:MAG: ribosome recycling factor [Candidatus Peribacteria bacterium]|nr:MAG: ribosome recycling factor [Candidatus Peribacteria bacterium]